MPNGTTQDVRIGPPPFLEPGRWGYLKDNDTGARVLYWDRELKFPDYTSSRPRGLFSRKIKVEYELEEVSLIIDKKKVGDVRIAIITKLR